MVSIEIPPNWLEEDRRWRRCSLAFLFISSGGKRWGASWLHRRYAYGEGENDQSSRSKGRKEGR